MNVFKRTTNSTSVTDDEVRIVRLGEREYWMFPSNAVVERRHIERFFPLCSGNYALYLEGGATVTLERRDAQAFIQRIRRKADFVREDENT